MGASTLEQRAVEMGDVIQAKAVIMHILGANQHRTLILIDLSASCRSTPNPFS